MAYIKYKIYPNDPKATEIEKSKAYDRFYLSLVMGWGTLGTIIYSIYSIVHSINNGISIDLLYSAISILAMSIIDFFVIFFDYDKDSKKQIVKAYLKIYYSGAVLLIAGTCVIVSIIGICNGDDREMLLIMSLLVFFIVICAICISVFRENYTPRRIQLFTDYDGLNKEIILQNGADDFTEKEMLHDVIYCYKCGKKMTISCAYCSSCGTKLKC